MVEFIILDSSLTDAEFESKVETVIGYAEESGTTTLSVYPSFLERAAIAIEGCSDISLASLSLSAAHTYTEVAMLECAMALENGADEIVVPINISTVRQGALEEAMGRIEAIAEEIGDGALLSVYLDNTKFTSFEPIKEVIRALASSSANSLTIDIDGSKISYLKESADYLLQVNKELNSSLSLKVTMASTTGEFDQAASNFIESQGLEGSVRLSVLL